MPEDPPAIFNRTFSSKTCSTLMPQTTSTTVHSPNQCDPTGVPTTTRPECWGQAREHYTKTVTTRSELNLGESDRGSWNNDHSGDNTQVTANQVGVEEETFQCEEGASEIWLGGANSSYSGWPKSFRPSGHLTRGPVSHHWTESLLGGPLR